jgi:hypothetical protein
MAYMSQEKKAKIAPAVKSILKKYGVKGSLSVHNHSSLVLNIKSGKLDFIKNSNETVEQTPRGFGYGSPAKDYIQVNTYWYFEHFSGKCRDFLQEILEAMNNGNHDNSNSQIDYFDVGWYVNVNIGLWNKPYKLED